MTTARPTATKVDNSPNWLRIVNYLVRDAGRRRGSLSMDELRSLAGLATAKARANYRPDRARCCLRRWVYRWGRQLLMAEIRDELARRRRSVPAVTFTDLGGACAENCPQAFLSLPGSVASSHQAVELEEMLDALSPVNRGIILLRSQHWTLGQIGHKFGLSGEAIRLRLRRIRVFVERRAIRSV